MSSKKGRRIGLFGGSFDPIHFGHLNLALSLIENGSVDEIIFCPAHTSPLKKDEPPSASNEARLKMISLAIAPIKEFSLLDWEIKRAPPSYTINTVRHLLAQEENRGAELRLILGDDALHTLMRWKEVEELLRLAPPLIGSRLGDFLTEIPSSLIQTVKNSLVHIPVLEISSTEVRSRLRQKKFCGYLVPSKVLDYIAENNLYSL
ncbi:MAG: nicotinate (nicotinamide) nucleotide adenylyltransferase [Chlamydiales bacterium]|nr:nicotinate (nicotinamide) nucleotide adenylyltransferase [Chlamydiales bacterium]